MLRYTLITVTYGLIIPESLVTMQLLSSYDRTVSSGCIPALLFQDMILQLDTPNTFLYNIANAGVPVSTGLTI